jgi:DNA mismatch repair protein MutS
VPAPVVRRAGQLLAMLERNAGPLGGRAPATAEALPLFAAAPPAPNPAESLTELPKAPDPVREAVTSVNPDAMTPREALEFLYEIKRLIAVPDANPALPSS